MHQLNDLLKPQFVHPYGYKYFFPFTQTLLFQNTLYEMPKVIVAQVYSTLNVKMVIMSAKGYTDILANY